MVVVTSRVPDVARQALVTFPFTRIEPKTEMVDFELWQNSDLNRLGERAPETLRYAVSSSAPLSADAQRDFQTCAQVPLYGSYGLSELSGLVTFGYPGQPPGTVGRPVGCELRLTAAGEVIVRPLKDRLTRVPGISGATDLGDGRPTLVLDLISLGAQLAAFLPKEAA